ncbi:MAG TPA: hypothetical protein VLH56_11255 [Dissulfurispiraceae bacterium]|nr:hypothetical protein [Dissulfurispiraceae bacterium]
MSKFIELTNKGVAFFVNSSHIVEFGPLTRDSGFYFSTVLEDRDGFRNCDQSPAEIMAKIQAPDPVPFTTEEASVICDLIFKHGDADPVQLGIMDKCARIVRAAVDGKEAK